MQIQLHLECIAQCFKYFVEPRKFESLGNSSQHSTEIARGIARKPTNGSFYFRFFTRLRSDLTHDHLNLHWLGWKT